MVAPYGSGRQPRVALHRPSGGQFTQGYNSITLSVSGIATSRLPCKGKISIARREAPGFKIGGNTRPAKYFVQCLLVAPGGVWQVDYTDLYLKLPNKCTAFFIELQISIDLSGCAARRALYLYI